MSRSVRKPYATIVGIPHAQDDKRLANRGVRRRQNQALRIALDYDRFLVPHRFECSWNDVWSWSQDGKKRPERPPDPNHYRTGWWADHNGEHYLQHALRWYERLFRK